MQVEESIGPQVGPEAPRVLQFYLQLPYATFAGIVVWGYQGVFKNIVPEVWLGTKDFTEYDGDEEGVVNNILSEFETIKQKIWPISNLY